MWKRAVILVSFAENDHLGCEKHCQFCPFDRMNYNIEIKPKDEDVINFISNVEPGCEIEICGGGDPLYNFEKNKDYLVHLISLIRAHDHPVQLVTKYYDIVAKYWNTELKEIYKYNFSTEILDAKLKDLIAILIQNNKKVRISKVYHDENWQVDRDYIFKYLNFYSSLQSNNFSVALRSNYNKPFPYELLNQEKRNLNNLHSYTKGWEHYHFYLHSGFITTPQLWGNEIVRCCDTIDKIKKDLGYDINKE